jgi:hypothetical protein
MNKQINKINNFFLKFLQEKNEFIKKIIFFKLMN